MSVIFEGVRGERQFNPSINISSVEFRNILPIFSSCWKKPRPSVIFEGVRDERQFKALTGVSYEEFKKCMFNAVRIYDRLYNRRVQVIYVHSGSPGKVVNKN